ncbi:MAG: YcaO-like family protein [Natronomonas sp.]
MTEVGVVGTGPAAEAVRTALGDTDAAVRTIESTATRSVSLAVVVASTGSESLSAATDDARATGTPHVVVELGGIGDRAVADVDAAVSGHTEETACYDCLCTRIGAADPETDDGATTAADARLAGAVAGRSAVELLSDAESDTAGTVVELPYTERRLLPVPGCDCGDGLDRRLRRTQDSRDLGAAIAAAEIAFDERLGPIDSIGEAESFPVPYYLASLAATPFSDADVPEHAAGVATEWDPAFMKALGEALERYSGGVYRTSTFLETHPNPVDPARFVQPDPVAEDVGSWYPAEHLTSGESVGLPAELVVFPPPTRSIRPAITTGLGLGNGGIEALLSGLYEIIERDAAMLSWYSTYDPLLIDLDDERLTTLRRRLRSEDLSVTPLLCTVDVDVPVVASCVHRDSEWPRFATGLAADLDPADAVVAATEEATQNWLELRRMGPERATEQPGAIGRYADFPEAARSFVDPYTKVSADSVGVDDPPSGAAELDALLSAIDAAGLDAYGARLTPRDVESLGFEAVRAVVPAAQPLFTDDPYFGERAKSVPRSLGFEPRPEREHHPFP